MIATTTAWIALGANLGRRGEALGRIGAALAAGPPRLCVEAVSRELLTRAVGVTRQPDYHNQVIRLRSSGPLEPLEWLQLCQAAERVAGRRPTYPWGPRRADADILLLGERGDLCLESGAITVPHPRLGERWFLCALLAELAPELVHPGGWHFADRAAPPRTRAAAGRQGC